jgi:hypothetical protein
MSVDFQRFERVRARQRSARRRWRSLLAALAVVTAIIVAVPLAWSALPDWRDVVPFLDRGASLIRETRGRVEAIERDSRTIRITSGFLGLASVALVVTDRTVIVVGEKEGGFGDLRQGEPVVAAYESGRPPLQATRVEVVTPARPPGP